MPLTNYRCAYCKRESVASPEPGKPDTWLPASWHLEAGPGHQGAAVIGLCPPCAAYLGRRCAACDEDIETTTGRCKCNG